MDRKRKWDQPGEEGDSVVKAQKTEDGSKSATAAAAAVSFLLFFFADLAHVSRIQTHTSSRLLLLRKLRPNSLVLQPQ